MEQKKETKATIERKMKSAIVFVPKDKNTNNIFFDDKGLRLTVTSDYAIIATGYHRHVFDAYNMAQGISRPYLYTKRVIEIALGNDCGVRDNKGNVTGYSFAVLLDILKKKEDKSEYNIVYYAGWWFTNLFAPLYSVGETDVETFMTYFDYCCVIAKNSVLLSEKTEDMTNKQFFDKFIEIMSEFKDNTAEAVVFHKKTDGELAQENAEAIAEQELNEHVQQNGGKD